MRCIHGIDIGTGSTKGVSVGTKGTVLFATQEYYPAGFSHTEQDPEVIWLAFVKVVRQLQARTQAPAAVSLSSAMHSVMVVDVLGKPLTPLLTWADDRAATSAALLRQEELGKTLYEQCGTPIHALSPLCKIGWWQEHEPLFGKAHKFIGIKEWIWFRLFGVFEIDYSLASSTGMLHLASKTWYKPALEWAGIEENQLSAPVDTTTVRRGLLAAAAATLEIPDTTAFIIGASDGCLASLGTAALAPGTAAVTIGTSGAVRVAASQPLPSWPAQLFNYYLADGLWITGGAINNGGAAAEWAASLFYEDEKEAAFNSWAEVPPGANGLIFLPYLLGERAPIWDSASSGAFIGLRQNHKKAHLLRAVLEGVCFALRSVLQEVESGGRTVARLHLSGGLARSEAAPQLLAHVTGKTVVRLQTEDASALGAAFLGMKALQWIPGFDELPPPAAPALFEADKTLYGQYSELFAVYQGLYPALQNAMHQLRQLARQ